MSTVPTLKTLLFRIFNLGCKISHYTLISGKNLQLGIMAKDKKVGDT